MALSFKDESNGNIVMGAGSAGSWEFGASTPSTTAGVVSVDGVLLNTVSPFNLGSALANSTSLNRTTSTVSVPAGAGNSASIDTSSKSDYTVVSWEQRNSGVMILTLGTTSVTFLNVNQTALAFTITYSWI